MKSDGKEEEGGRSESRALLKVASATSAQCGQQHRSATQKLESSKTSTSASQTGQHRRAMSNRDCLSLKKYRKTSICDREIT